MHTSRDSKERKSKTCEALEILGAEKPYGDRVKKEEELDLDKDYEPKHTPLEYQ